MNQPTDIRTLATAIAAHLHGFELDTRQFDEHGNLAPTLAHLRREGRPEIAIALHFRDGRVATTGIYPVVEYPPNSPRPRITTAISRGAAAIARDIERRFLPAYLARFEQTLRAGIREQERSDQAQALRERVEEALGSTLSPAHHADTSSDHTLRLNSATPVYGRIRVTCSNVEFKLGSVPPDIAVAICEAIARSADTH